MDIDLIKQNLAAQNLNAAKRQSSSSSQIKPQEKELKEACAGFEAILLHTMVKSMRETLPGDGLFQKSHGMDIYKSMHDQYLAEELSKSKTTIGIKEFLYQQLKKSL